MDKKMISTFRTLVVEKERENITDESMLRAMTVNAELNALGYTLKPIGIIALAKADMSRIVVDFKDAIGEVKAKPMYPNFPMQVMEMEEAEFRLHQLLHYFSTYGVEKMLGVDVEKGWLPKVENTEKVKEDDTLLSLKVLDVIYTDEQSDYVITKLARKNERFTLEEMTLFEEATKDASHEVLISMNVEFKENLVPVFKMIFEGNREDKKEILVGLCQHTGDVMKCARPLLEARHDSKHFNTSEKRLLVKVFEAFPIADFKANLILSNSKAEDAKILIQYLDYNTFSRSKAHKKAVAKLRNNQLRSWEGKAKALISEENEDALTFIGERPGMMVRMLTILLRAGYDAEKIAEILVEKGEALSTQTLVSLLTHFGEKNAKRFDDTLHDKKEANAVFEIVRKALISNLACKETPIRDQKVYLDNGNINLELSRLECNIKSPESGYLASGLAINILEDIKRLRFFLYWNDKERTDLDLHTFAITTEGEGVHIGWNGEYNNHNIVYSGDITHSDAAEYVDVDLTSDIEQVKTDIDVYYAGSKECKMKNIDTVFVGMMAVKKLGEDVKLYDPKNCFFSHFLKGDEKTIEYGFIDVPHRVLVFTGKPKTTYGMKGKMELENRFNLKAYLDLLLASQHAVFVENEEDADVILTMEKSTKENAISLIDENFYLDA